MVKELLESDPTSARYRDQHAATNDALGQALLALDQLDDAQVSFAEAIQSYQLLSQEYPERPDYLERLAVAQSHLARTLAASSIAVDANHDATVEMASQGFRAAADTLNELMDVFPDLPRYQEEAAYVAYYHGTFLRTQDEPSAKEMFATARDLWIILADKRSATATERLAWLLATCPIEELRDTSTAVELAREALISADANPHFRCTLALAQVQNGDLEAARETFANVEQASEKSGRQWLTISLIRAARGDAPGAEEAMTRGVAWFQDQAPLHHDFLVLRSLRDGP